MKSRIRTIVEDVLSCACSQTAREREKLIAALEAHHERALAEAAEGALAARAALDRVLGGLRLSNAHDEAALVQAFEGKGQGAFTLTP